MSGESNRVAIRRELADIVWPSIMSSPTSPNRRDFLATTSASAASLWIPTAVNGYTNDEALQPSENRVVQVGMSKWDLDTPALCVDLDKMEANIAAAQAVLKKNGVAARPHAKTHKCAAIAKLQLAAGAVGICTAKLSEAEALFAQGVDRICMTTANLSAAKVRRAMLLRKRNAHFIQAVDYAPNARDLSAAAKEAGITADVVIDVAVGTRSGVPAGEEAIALAKLVDSLPNLKLRGLLSYDGGAQHINGFAARKERALKGLEDNVATYDAMKAARIEHRDLQWRRHRHVQRPASDARLHRRPGRKLHLHGHAVPRHRQRRRRSRLQGLRPRHSRSSAPSSTTASPGGSRPMRAPRRLRSTRRVRVSSANPAWTTTPGPTSSGSSPSRTHRRTTRLAIGSR